MMDVQPDQLEEKAIETTVIEGSGAEIPENNDVNVAIETTINDGSAEIPENNDVSVDLGFEEDEDNNIMGMVLENLDDGYGFYNRYALLHGFGIRTFMTYKNKVTKEIYRRKYVCNKEGYKDSNVKAKKRRRETRTGCQAFLWITKRKDWKWFVDMFHDVHNHELTATPTKVMKHRSHRKFHRSMACKSLMLELGRSGLKPCQIRKVVNTVKSPLENDVTSKQCADILAEQRKQYKEFCVRKHIEAREKREKNLEVKRSNEKERDEFEHESQVIRGEHVEERKMVAMEDFV